MILFTYETTIALVSLRWVHVTSLSSTRTIPPVNPTLTHTPTRTDLLYPSLPWVVSTSDSWLSPFLPSQPLPYSRQEPMVSDSCLRPFLPSQPLPCNRQELLVSGSCLRTSYSLNLFRVTDKDPPCRTLVSPSFLYSQPLPCDREGPPVSDSRISVLPTLSASSVQQTRTSGVGLCPLCPHPDFYLDPEWVEPFQDGRQEDRIQPWLSLSPFWKLFFYWLD